MDSGLKDSMDVEAENPLMGNAAHTEVEVEKGSVEKPNSLQEDHGEEKESRLIYPVDSTPPMLVTVLCALQQVLTMMGGPVSAAFILRRITCSAGDQEFLSQLISTNLFMSGLCTILQVSIGIRLPVIQGSSFTYFSILASMMATSTWKCPNIEGIEPNGTLIYISVDNSSVAITYQDLWKPRMLEASGSLIVASLVQVLLGSCGLIGFMMRFIGPLTIAPTIMLIGISICDSIVATSKHQWGIALGTAGVIVAVLSFLSDVRVPLPSYSRERGCHIERYFLFRLLPQTVAISICWSLCAVLTAFNVFPDDPKQPSYLARTDINLDWISQSSWFFIPYPGMWGWPTFSAGTFCGMLAATISSIIESVGDYYATAQAAEVPAPPKHAMNRGIAMEGVGSIICGLLGAGHATTSYSGVVGSITLTGMASRRTWIVVGIFLMIFGMFGKLAAILSIIPEPIVGGLMSVGISMVIGVGISTLHCVDLTSGRNLLVIGMSLLLGTTIPSWIKDNPDAIETGNQTADMILVILLSTSMLVGGVTAFAMDNILPGTIEERGFDKFNHQGSTKDVWDSNDASGFSVTRTKKLYGLPLSQCCASLSNPDSMVGRLATFIPFLPCYMDRNCCSSKLSSRTESKADKVIT